MTTTFDLGDFSDEEKATLKGDSPIKRKMNDILKKSRAAAKQDTCFHCGKKVESFCNSHSVPAFCLKNIASNGMLLTLNSMVGMPFLDREKGVKGAGTFHLICRECDNTVFADYENPENYADVPTAKMIAQIALKNYLKDISKRLLELEMYRIAPIEAGKTSPLFDMKTDISNIDLREYIKGYQKAKKALEKNRTSEYYVCYYEKLPYVVPLAFQSTVALVFDFEGNIINNIYNTSSTYEIKNINICVLPLESETVLLMFVDDGDKRYRNFYKQFNKLEPNDKLQALTFIMFAYSEDIYLSKSLESTVDGNKPLCQIARNSQDILSITPFFDPMKTLKKSYNLEMRHTIPNLLSEEFKLR